MYQVSKSIILERKWLHLYVTNVSNYLIVGNYKVQHSIGFSEIILIHYILKNILPTNKVILPTYIICLIFLISRYFSIIGWTIYYITLLHIDV